MSQSEEARICQCGHALVDHAAEYDQPCIQEGCECNRFRSSAILSVSGAYQLFDTHGVLVGYHIPEQGARLLFTQDMAEQLINRTIAAWEARTLIRDRIVNHLDDYVGQPLSDEVAEEIIQHVIEDFTDAAYDEVDNPDAVAEAATTALAEAYRLRGGQNHRVWTSFTVTTREPPPPSADLASQTADDMDPMQMVEQLNALLDDVVAPIGDPLLDQPAAEPLGVFTRDRVNEFTRTRNYTDNPSQRLVPPILHNEPVRHDTVPAIGRPYDPMANVAPSVPLETLRNPPPPTDPTRQSSAQRDSQARQHVRNQLLAAKAFLADPSTQSPVSYQALDPAEVPDFSAIQLRLMDQLMASMGVPGRLVGNWSAAAAGVPMGATSSPQPGTPPPSESIRDAVRAMRRAMQSRDSILPDMLLPGSAPLYVSPRTLELIRQGADESVMAPFLVGVNLVVSEHVPDGEIWRTVPMDPVMGAPPPG